MHELNGKQVTQEQFLKDADYRETWQGVEIGVFDVLFDGEASINFHGLEVPHELASVESYRDWEFSIKVDVKECPDLQLVLPDRKEIVKNDFYHELVKRGYQAIFRYIATLPSHRLPYKTWRYAKELGIELPEAQSVLLKYEPTRTDRVNTNYVGEIVIHDPESTFFVKPLRHPALEQTLAWAVKRHNESGENPFMLVAPYDGYKGYSWYDSIPTIEEVFVEVENEKGMVRIDDAVAESLLSGRYQRIALVVTVKSPDGSYRLLKLPTNLALWDLQQSDPDWSESARIWIEKNHDINPVELIDALRKSFQEHSYEYDTATELFEEEACHHVNDLLVGEENAMLVPLQVMVERKLAYLIPDNKTVTIRRQLSGRIRVNYS